MAGASLRSWPAEQVQPGQRRLIGGRVLLTVVAPGSIRAKPNESEERADPDLPVKAVTLLKTYCYDSQAGEHPLVSLVQAVKNRLGITSRLVPTK